MVVAHQPTVSGMALVVECSVFIFRSGTLAHLGALVDLFGGKQCAPTKNIKVNNGARHSSVAVSRVLFDGISGEYC